MPDEQALTGPEIMSRLGDEARRFYKKFGAPVPDGAASDFEEAYLALFRNIKRWIANRPQLPEERRGQGRKLFLPSQERSRLLTELKDIANILDSIVKRRLAEKSKRGRPWERTEISSDACEAILGPSSVRKALFAPLHERGVEVPLDGNFNQAVIWGHDDSRIDTILTKRASRQLALGRSSVGYGLSAVERRLLPRTARLLFVGSNGFRQAVPIEALVGAMDSASITNLAENARAAEKELRVEFGTEHTGDNAQPNRTATDFRSPAPFYGFVRALLEAGWAFDAPGVQISVYDRERLLVGRKGRDFEIALVKLLARATQWAKQIGTEFFRLDEFDLFVGIDLIELLKDKGVTRRDHDIEEEVPTAISRIARRIVTLREQIVVLRDHAATLERWCDWLRERAETETELLDDATFLKTHAFYRLSESAQECEHQYYEGVFFAPDWRRRASGTPFHVKELSVELLRKSYPTEDFGGPRWADVTAKQMTDLLESLYDQKDPIFLRTKAILEKHLVTRHGATGLS